MVGARRNPSFGRYPDISENTLSGGSVVPGEIEWVTTNFERHGYVKLRFQGFMKRIVQLFMFAIARRFTRRKRSNGSSLGRAFRQKGTGGWYFKKLEVKTKAARLEADEQTNIRRDGTAD
jgi:hypothetical protein